MMVTHRSITTNVSQLSWEEDFIRIKFLDTDKKFDLREANRQYLAAKELASGKHYRVLIDIRDVYVSPEKEAQDYLSKVEEKIAEAILVNNLATRILSKFYVKKNKKSPVKIFTNEAKAIDWLTSQD